MAKVKEKAISRKPVMVSLYSEDLSMLEELAAIYGCNKSEVLRFLIKNACTDVSVFKNGYYVLKDIEKPDDFYIRDDVIVLSDFVSLFAKSIKVYHGFSADYDALMYGYAFKHSVYKNEGKVL